MVVHRHRVRSLLSCFRLIENRQVNADLDFHSLNGGSHSNELEARFACVELPFHRTQKCVSSDLWKLLCPRVPRLFLSIGSMSDHNCCAGLIVIYSCIKSIKLCLSKIKPINLDVLRQKSISPWLLYDVHSLNSILRFHFVSRSIHRKSQIEINECESESKNVIWGSVPTIIIFLVFDCLLVCSRGLRSNEVHSYPYPTAIQHARAPVCFCALASHPVLPPIECGSWLECFRTM